MRRKKAAVALATSPRELRPRKVRSALVITSRTELPGRMRLLTLWLARHFRWLALSGAATWPLPLSRSRLTWLLRQQPGKRWCGVASPPQLWTICSMAHLLHLSAV